MKSNPIHPRATVLTLLCILAASLSGPCLVAATAQNQDSLSVLREPPGPSNRRSPFAISEIMYHPRDISGSETQSLEFIEIYNSQAWDEDISGFRLSAAVDYVFPPGTIIKSQGYLVVARDPSSVQSHYEISGVLGPWEGVGLGGASTNGLPNDNGKIRLRGRSNEVLLEVNYSDHHPFPISPDGAGHSLVLVRPSYGEGDPRAWGASDLIDGSPGQRDDVGEEPLREVVINEFLAHTDDPQLDFIELYNHSNLSVDLSGAWLSDTHLAFSGRDPDTNKFRIPDGTILLPRGFVSFDQNQLGFALSSRGESIFLVNADLTRVIDAIRFEGQAGGVASGRRPDGAPGIQELQSPTPGATNVLMLTRDIIVSEIMYHPISRNSDDEYIELHNQGANTVSLAGWELNDGVRFTFPTSASIPPGGYLVVANNLTNLLAKYPQLDTSNAVGNFKGQLADRGERIALSSPESSVGTNSAGVIITNIYQIVVDEVTYGEGGRWSRWADAGGSSLELIDPRSDNRLADNWTPSDETGKAGWTTIEVTGVLDHASLSSTALEIYLMGEGECLLDEVEVLTASGVNVLPNGSLASELTPWLAQGNHGTSTWQPNGGVNDSGCLHVQATGKGDASMNRLQVGLTSGLSLDSTATLRAKVLWLRGHPQILLRLFGNGLEAFGNLVIPSSAGTPGLPNSRAVANVGPAIFDVTHYPVLPLAEEPVVVTARLHDSHDLSQAAVHYRIDPDVTSISAVPLLDDGTGGDAVAGDGLFSATLPGQPEGALLAFFVEATDDAPEPLSRTFPSDAPVRECLVRFGESQPAGAFATYRIWITQASFDRWLARSGYSDAAVDATFVYGNQRVIYNVGALYAGAGAGAQTYTTPTGQACDYKLLFPEDDRFLGHDEASILWPGLSGARIHDLTGQQEQTVYWVGASLGLPFNYQRHVHVFFNGQQRSYLMLDTQKPGRDMVEQWYPDQSEGDLFKIVLQREFNANGTIAQTTSAKLGNFTTSDGTKKTAAYRRWWSPRATRNQNDFIGLFALADAVNRPDINYTTEVERVVDIEQWMRTFAVEHIVGNWDSYGYGLGQNMYAYKPKKGGWKMIMWDVDVSLAIGDPAHTDLFKLTNPFWTDVDGDPAVVGRMFDHPRFARAYWRALQDAVNGPLVATRIDALMDAKEAAFAASGIPVTSTSALKSFLSQRRAFIVSQLATVEAEFASTAPALVESSNNLVYLSGTAPIGVRDLTFNGMPFPVTWISVNEWSARVIAPSGTSQVVVRGLDLHGREMPGMVLAITVVQTGPNDDPAGAVVFSEIMYHPTTPEASFVEIHNRSATMSFDLSDWKINGLDFDFAKGTILTNGQYLVVAKNRTAFYSAYGDDIAVAGEFDGNLDPDGETLTLTKPGVDGAPVIVIDKVRYEPGAPWIATANGTGRSLQLTDAAQDNSRVSNWSDGAGWTYYDYTGSLGSIITFFGTNLSFTLEGAGEVLIDDVELVQGDVAGVGLNVIDNPGFETGSLDPWQVMGVFTNTFVTTESAHRGNHSLHVVATGPGSSFAAVRQSLSGDNMDSAQTYTLSFWFFRIAPNNLNFRVTSSFRSGIAPSPTPPIDVDPVLSSPGQTNTSTAFLPAYDPIWLNEVQPLNATGATDGFGERDAWVELFNRGASTVSLDGYYLTDHYGSNQILWAFPHGTSITPGEFKVVWMDGQTEQSSPDELHASITLNASTGSVALVRLVNDLPQITDYLNYSGLLADEAYGDYPDGQPFKRIVFNIATPGSGNLPPPATITINEWMASNVAHLADPVDGHFDDWFELYNGGTEAVDLTGYFLTDDLNKKKQFQIPAGHLLAPGEFLLIWADNTPEQNLTGATSLHANFALGRSGESLGLYAPNGLTIDEVTFGPQGDDVSEGRLPDGSAQVGFMTTPTPGAPNRLGEGNTAPALDPIADRVVILGQTLAFHITATDADIPSQALTYTLLSGAPNGSFLDATSGQFTWTPSSTQALGSTLITVRVMDNGAPLMSDQISFTVTVFPPPEIAILRLEAEVSISFSALNGRTYRVFFADDLRPPVVWQSLGQDIVATASIIIIKDPIRTRQQRFYRVGLTD